MHNTKIHLCKDGSHTLYSEKFSQHYHNPNGAVAESRHVFFDVPGIPQKIQPADSFSVFEMGFGTGLNLILMKDYLEAGNPRCKVRFRSVEAFPIGPDTVQHLVFGSELERHNPRDILGNIFENLEPGLNRFDIDSRIDLELFYGRFDEMPVPAGKTDAFFHDPFSPEVNGELWTVEVFERLLSMAKPGAVMSTYCAASSARAAMAVAGWKVAKAAGALGKREMTIASPGEKQLKGFKQVNEERLIHRYQAGDFDHASKPDEV
jgi:tRNA U34 5-methylaminomethyl-2-thiouridine-forming methyltransferase MnmC